MSEPKPNPRPADDDSVIQGRNWFSDKVVVLICWLTPKCTEMTRLISEGMDYPLPWPTRFKMRLHNLMCCYCERYDRNLRYVRSLTKHLDDAPGASLPPDAKQKLKQALRDEQGKS